MKTQSQKKFKNSYVYIHISWENCIMSASMDNNDIIKNQRYLDIASKKNKLVYSRLKNIGKFPVKYHKFAKFISLKKFDMILEEFPDLALKFVYKTSNDNNSSKELGTYIIHGSKFTKINSLQPNSNNITCKIKYDLNGSEDLANSELSTFDKTDESTVNIMGKDLLNCQELINQYKNMNCDDKVFAQYIYENLSKKEETESDSDTISNISDSKQRLFKWLKKINENTKNNTKNK